VRCPAPTRSHSAVYAVTATTSPLRSDQHGLPTGCPCPQRAHLSMRSSARVSAPRLRLALLRPHGDRVRHAARCGAARLSRRRKSGDVC
jgi:hypothetical protein